jgi:RimJ/RimL family protein N-acetyltransferase
MQEQPTPHPYFHRLLGALLTPASQAGLLRAPARAGRPAAAAVVSAMPSTALELMTIQAEGSFDRHGRIVGLYGLTMVCTDHAQALWLGADVPAATADELVAAFDRAPRAREAHEPPPVLDLCRRILDADARALPRSAGPSYLIEEGSASEPAVHIERSDTSSGAALRSANPGNWQPVEWEELLDGRLGPWAIAVEGDRAVSICHTPRPLTTRAAECGVWTDPAFRGRGYAAALTSAWAAIVRPSGRYLFYSTEADNLSSQRVVERLGLRPLGWTWRLGRARGGADGGAVHPLSSLRSLGKP